LKFFEKKEGCRGLLQVEFVGEGKLFEKSFPSPTPLSFQKLLKMREKKGHNMV